MRRKIDINLVKSEFDKVGYKLLSKEYKNNTQKLNYICPNHISKGVQSISFANFSRGRRCPYCSRRKKRTHEEYIEDLKKVNKTIIPLESYQNLKTKIRHRCLVCGYEWSICPTNLLHLKHGCPKCSKRAKLTHDEVVSIIHKVNPYVKILDCYIDDMTKIRFKCTRCGHIWFAKPNNIRQGKGCPLCKSSHGEKRIVSILFDMKIDFQKEYIFKDCKYETYLPFDFYIEKFNMCIEYDGKQHFEPCCFGGMSIEDALENLKLTKIKDKIKNEYCKKNGIKLIRIPYWEYKNIENIIQTSLT